MLNAEERERFADEAHVDDDLIAERRAEQRETMRFDVSDAVSALKADLQACAEQCSDISTKAHEDDEWIFEAVEALIDDAVATLRPGWPEQPRGGMRERIRELERENARLRATS